MRLSSLLIPIVLVAPLGGLGPGPQPMTWAQESNEPAKSRAGAGAGAPTPAVEAETAADTAGSAVTIPGTEQFDLRSKSGLEYRIFVAKPTGEVPETGAPIIYLSDGNANFPVLLNAARRFAREAQPTVVVGIGYPTDDGAIHRERRSNDLTPGPPATQQEDAPPLKPAGNDRFLAFIEEELKPRIEQKYKINRDRQTLFGHSFGGLFVLHVLFNKPESFQTYLASSPSIWWNDGSLLIEEKAFTERFAAKEVKARLLLTVGEWEQNSRPSVSKERANLLKQRQMVGSAKDLATRLVASQLKGLTVEFREFAEEEHGSVVLPAASRGVRFALEER